MKSNLLDIYGAYADGYCEELAPSALPHFYHAAGSVTFKRLFGYPEYVMVFDQATEYSGGREAVGFEPVAQELLLKLTCPRMLKADKEALVAFWRDVVNGSAKPFTYSNNALHPALPVRFADGELPEMPEVAYQQYQVSLTLRVDVNLPQHPCPAGNAPAGLTGNRFVIGSFALPLPAPLRDGSSSGLTKLQPAGRDSAGSLVIYDKSRIVTLSHRLSLVMTYDQFCGLQALFFSFVHGARTPFTWVDETAASHTVRLFGKEITVRQTGPDRFEADLALSEELSA